MTPSMQNVLDWFVWHPNTPTTIGDLAEQLGMKTSTTAGAFLMLNRRGALSREGDTYILVTATPDMHTWLVGTVTNVQQRQLSADTDPHRVGVRSWRDVEPDMVSMSHREYNGLVADLIDAGSLVQITTYTNGNRRDILRTPDLQQLVLDEEHRQEQLHQRADQVRRAITRRAERVATDAAQQVLDGLEPDYTLVRTITRAVVTTLRTELRRAIDMQLVDIDTLLTTEENQ